MKLNKAFTFIELCMALLIFSVIATSIYYALHSGMELWSRGNSAIRDNQKLRVFFNAVSSDLRNIVPCSGMESMEREWGAERISFPTVTGTSYGIATGKEIVGAVYYFDGEKSELKRSYATAKEGFDEESAEAETLLDDLESAGFEYAYEIEEGYDWREKWELEDAPPRAVKVKCKFREESGKTPQSFEKIVFIPIGKFGKEE